MKWIAAVAAVLLLAGCQTTMDTGSQCVVEPGYLDDTTQIHWRGLEVNDTTGYVSPIVADRLELAVKEELARKGFELSDAESATELSLTLHTRRELVSWESTGSPCEGNDCWERIDLGAGTRFDVRTIGFLSADVFDDEKPIWRGWVETNLYPKDRDQADEIIARAVPALLSAFPP